MRASPPALVVRRTNSAASRGATQSPRIDEPQVGVGAWDLGVADDGAKDAKVPTSPWYGRRLGAKFIVRTFCREAPALR